MTRHTFNVLNHFNRSYPEWTARLHHQLMRSSRDYSSKQSRARRLLLTSFQKISKLREMHLNALDVACAGTELRARGGGQGFTSHTCVFGAKRRQTVTWESKRTKTTSRRLFYPLKRGLRAGRACVAQLNANYSKTKKNIPFEHLQTGLNTATVETLSMCIESRAKRANELTITSSPSSSISSPLQTNSTVPFLDILWQRQWGPGRHFKFERRKSLF